MTTIILTGGRGSVVGELIHSNPNYTVMVVNGIERYVPARLIERVIR